MGKLLTDKQAAELLLKVTAKSKVPPDVHGGVVYGVGDLASLKISVPELDGKTGRIGAALLRKTKSVKTSFAACNVPESVTWDFDAHGERKIDAETLDAIIEAAPYAEKDPNRGALCCVCVDTENNAVVATDGHRLFLRHGVAGETGNDKYLIPAKAADILSKLRSLGVPFGGAITKGSEQYLELSGENWMLRILLNTGNQYPDYPRVIPDNNPYEKHVTVEQIKHLAAATKAVLPFTGGSYNMIRVRGDEAAAVNSDINKNVHVKTASMLRMYDAMGFNGKYLNEILNHVAKVAPASGIVSITSSAIITAVTIIAGNNLWLLMPLRIKNTLTDDGWPTEGAEYIDVGPVPAGVPDPLMDSAVLDTLRADAYTSTIHAVEAAADVLKVAFDADDVPPDGAEEAMNEAVKYAELWTEPDGIEPEPESVNNEPTTEPASNDIDTSEPEFGAVPMSLAEWSVLSRLMRRDGRGRYYEKEGAGIAETVKRVQTIFDNMPRTYETDGQGDKAIVYLHYFTAGCDWWIIERDVEKEQFQAFGFACLNGDTDNAELGYISLKEITDCGAELDLYFEPRPLSEVKAALGIPPMNGPDTNGPGPEPTEPPPTPTTPDPSNDLVGFLESKGWDVVPVDTDDEPDDEPTDTEPAIKAGPCPDVRELWEELNALKAKVAYIEEALRQEHFN